MINKDFLQSALAKYEIDITQMQLDQFDLYAKLLVEWNEKINLTSITDPDEIVIKHFVDSLLLLRAANLPQGASLIDVGTGAGFPSTPLAILRRDLQITQLDSLNKRILFLQEVSDQLGLSIKTVHLRAEEGGKSAEFREKYDYATARAVANLQTLSEYCIPFVKPGGFFIALKGIEVEEELCSAKRAIQTLGAQLERVEKLQLPNQDGRSIVLIKKISQTPQKYPRMQGKIKKNPL